MRTIDQLPRSTEASVRESTEDAVLLIWKPGDYDHVYFMFVSQLYRHHEQFHIHEWSMIVFSREMTGAVKRRVEDPPTQGSTPPNDDDPFHPDQHGDVPPNDDEMLSGDEPEDPLDDDNQPDYSTGPDPDDDDDQEYIIPDDHGPPPDDDLDMPGIQDSGEHINQAHHQLRFPILTFQWKRLLILDKITILHQDLIRRQSLSEFKGNRDRSQLILLLLMLYQRQRQR